MSPQRLLLDTHVVDALREDEALRDQVEDAARAGTVELLVTHLQIDEILEMPATKVDAQEALLQTLAELDATRVTTAGAMWDRSRWDEATLMSEEDAALFESLQGGNQRHTEDVLLLLTARREGAALVTNDRGARSRAARLGVLTMSTPELSDFLSRG